MNPTRFYIVLLAANRDYAVMPFMFSNHLGEYMCHNQLKLR
jgi:hypothetical protein